MTSAKRTKTSANGETGRCRIDASGCMAIAGLVFG
jgi:hypothetical protein